MRKSLLIAALGAVLPMFMSDVVAAAAAAPLPPGDVPATPATEAGMDPVGESTSTVAAAVVASAESTSTQPTSPVAESTAEVPNAAPAADAGAHEAGDAPAAGGDVPNGAPAAAEPTTALGSATSAVGADTTSPIAANSPVEQVPLRVTVAGHLEAIYRAVSDADKPAIDHAIGLKEHIGDVLHSIQNGIDVRSGEMVQKLEALFHKL